MDRTSSVDNLGIFRSTFPNCIGHYVSGGAKFRALNQSYVHSAFSRLGLCIDYTYTGRTVR